MRKIFNNTNSPSKYTLRKISQCKYVTLFFTITLLFSAYTALSFSSAGEASSEFEFRILVDDTLAILIWPPVENLSVDCIPPRSGGLRVLFSFKEERLWGNVSLVYVQPRNEGIYNLLVNFRSSVEWSGIIGVYTSDREFYGGAGSVSATPQGYFITLSGPIKMPQGDWKIIITLNVQGGSSSTFFSLKFPTPVNMALFILFSGILAYFNAFFILDSYFKSKTEGVSKIRLIIVSLLIFVSAFILYQVYNVMVGGETHV
ncbi:MAG: hypothetical protein QXX94_00915 [Candidatus Bathyarchaeia archaeon]